VIFEVARDANKIEIANAVEKLFNVKVTRREHDDRPRQGQAHGPRLREARNWKKAIVTLKRATSIEFFERQAE
jgi:large subunit ribosomal protein L23